MVSNKIEHFSRKGRKKNKHSEKMKVLGQRIQMLFISKIIKMSKDRERRLKATGRFFQPPKKIKYL